MAELGAIARGALGTLRRPEEVRVLTLHGGRITPTWRHTPALRSLRLRRIVAPLPNVMAPGARDDAEGVAAPGSLRLDGYGVWRFRWSVAAGRRTVSAKVKQPVNVAPRPQLAVLPNPALGVAVEVTADAPAGTDWVDLGPVTFTPSVAGVVWVELRALYDAPVPCWWDDVTLQ